MAAARYYIYKHIYTCIYNAVERRVAAVPAERASDLRVLDARLFGTPAGDRGPFEARLDAYPGGVRGLAVGAFGEWSNSLVGLVDALAEQGAERWMGRLAAPSLKQAKATLLRLWRQRLGMCALRGHARLMLARAHQLYLRPEHRGGVAGCVLRWVFRWGLARRGVCRSLRVRLMGRVRA